MATIIRQPQTFYRRTAAKKVVQWTIWIEEDSGVYTVKTSHGQKGGKIIEDAGTVITKGKSSRTPEEQAILQYDSKISKHRDKGYTFNTDGINVTLAPVPMTAQPYHKHGKKIIFPAIAQPKLDGVRCTAQLQDDGSVLLLSRRGKEWPLLDQIRTAISNSGIPTKTFILDGELYSDELDFQRVTGLVRKHSFKNQADIDDMKKVKLNVFDGINTLDKHQGFISRYKQAKKYVNKCGGVVTMVPVFKINSDTQVEGLLNKFIAQGDEGLILRNINSPYEIGKRSYHLQKHKRFYDQEYKIVGANEGKGNDIGTVVWTCETPKGQQFGVRPKGTREQRRQWYRDRKKYMGKMLTVKYQELTNDGIPRFPVGIAIRDYE